MEDEVIKSDDGQYKLTIWETNKAPALGFCRWDIRKYIPEFDWWLLVAESRGYGTYDTIRAEGLAQMESIQQVPVN